MSVVRRAINRLKSVVPDEYKRKLVPTYLRHQFQIYLEDFSKRPPVIVYTMGKVGSTAIEEVIRRAELPYSVYQAHSLVAERLQKWKKRYEREGHYTSRARHLWMAKALRRRLDEPLEEKWRVITGTREPISHVVSQFFQVVDRRYPEVFDEEGGIQEEKTLERLQSKIEDFDERTNFACSWFDRELKPVFGVDLYEEPFNHEAGYTIVERPEVKVLVYRVEDLGRCFAPALQEFFELEASLEPVTANASRDKDYHEAYERVKQRLSFEEELLSRVYSSRYVQHFYGEEMIERFKRRWSRTS